MNVHHCVQFKDELLRFLESRVDTVPLKDETCAIRTPFFDNVGDPIYVAIYQDGDSIRIEDTGTIAGHLFTLGQHTLNTPAFKLLHGIAEAYGLTLDFDKGTVTTEANSDNVIERVMDLTKAIITMVTATPLIRVPPHRVKPVGQRLRTRIKREYKRNNILALVQDDYELRGASGIPWPIDFHWWITPDPIATGPVASDSIDISHVYVVAADFNVQDPLVKANHVAALGLDTQRKGIDNLRVVIDHSRKDAEAREAMSLIRTHSKRLGFKVFDFDTPDERGNFLRQSTTEILDKAGESWRASWLETSGIAFKP